MKCVCVRERERGRERERNGEWESGYEERRKCWKFVMISLIDEIENYNLFIYMTWRVSHLVTNLRSKANY